MQESALAIELVNDRVIGDDMDKELWCEVETASSRFLPFIHPEIRFPKCIARRSKTKTSNA